MLLATCPGMIVLHKVLCDELMLDTCRNVCTKKYRVREICHIHHLGETTKQHRVEVFHASVAAVTDCTSSHGCCNNSIYVLYSSASLETRNQNSVSLSNSSWESSTYPGDTKGQCFFTCLSFKSRGLCSS